MRAPSVSVGSALDLGELAALISFAGVLVANNSAPAHIAAAVGTPVVDVYALTNPQHTPWQVPARVLSHDVPCRNCLRSVCPLGHNACIQLVPPAAVAAAACELLEHSA
jgi:ADP-heptose:LPS heptosyltransferase